MAEQPPSGNDGRRSDDGSGGPDFTWLYGKGGATTPPPPPGARPAPSDPTRMIPTQPRPSADPTVARPVVPRPGTAPTPPVPGPVEPIRASGPLPGDPYPPARGGGYGGGFGGFVRRRVTRPRFWIRTVLLLVVLFVVYTVAVPFLTWRHVEKVAWEPDGDRPADQPGTTYLLVGSDSRAGLSAAQRKEYHTGNPQENLSDTIMLLHTGSGPNVLLSIPRDSLVNIPGHGESKINAAYAYGGPQLLTQTIEQDTGIRVDKYVEIGLGGVASVVDAVGGIQICPDQAMDDVDAGLHIKKGCQEVDGRVALAYSRSRHAQLLGDLDRVKHQREVVAAIGHKVLSPWTVLNPVRWWKLNHAVPDFFGFGDGMSTLDAGKWAMAMSHTTGSSGKTCTMPVTDGSANHWDMTRAKPLFAAIISDKTDDITNAQCTPAGIQGAK